MIKFKDFLNEYFIFKTSREAGKVVQGMHDIDKSLRKIKSSHDLGNGYVFHEHTPSNLYPAYPVKPYTATITKDGKQVGGIHARYDTKRKSHVVEAIHVDKQHRGKGLGQALYNGLLAKHGHYTSDDYISKDAENVYKSLHAKGKVTFHDDKTHEKIENPKKKSDVYMKVWK